MAYETANLRAEPPVRVAPIVPEMALPLPRDGPETPVPPI
jgi:hypothetical protein